MATTAPTSSTRSAVDLDADLFDQAFEPTFGPFEPISASDRSRMTEEFAARFPELTALLDSARTTS